MLKYALNVRASKGEEEHLRACLSSVHATIGDRLSQVIVSLDKGMDESFIPNYFKNLKVIKKEWGNDFALMRNQMLEATGKSIDYVIWLDPDERLIVREKDSWVKLFNVIEQTKEKAYNLINNFIPNARYFEDGNKFTENAENAKQCALICVEEILGLFISDCEDIRFWNEVKEEINKL